MEFFSKKKKTALEHVLDIWRKDPDGRSRNRLCRHHAVSSSKVGFPVVGGETQLPGAGECVLRMGPALWSGTEHHA